MKMNMNINSSDGGNSNPTKKRKGNEGDAIVSDDRGSGGFFSSWFGYFSGRDAAPSTQCNHVNNNNNNTTLSSSQLDRMEQIMMRMEEKCSTLETELRSVKDRAGKLEDNVNSLRSDVQSIRVNAQQNHEYNQMVLKNKGWNYSAHVSTKIDWMSKGYSNYAASYLENTATLLKNLTVDMRRGIFPNCTPSYKGICLHPDVVAVGAESNGELRAHWDEFARAIRQFTPAIKMVPDNFDSYFSLGNILANQSTFTMIREALIGKSFTNMCFTHKIGVDIEVGGMNIDSIIRIAESNKSLRKLEIYNNRIGSDHVERLCSIARTNPLVELNLNNSIDDDDVGNAILTSLLSSQELKLEKLRMERTQITSDIITVLTNFIATNTKLKYLDLDDNSLNDNDALLIANALRSNTKLRTLYMDDNDLTIIGVEAFKPVMFDTSSLNTIATSNHSCYVSILDGCHESRYPLNTHEKIEDNRGIKIFYLLSVRHVKENLSNVQYFRDIDVKLLPNMLEAIQKYGQIWARGDICSWYNLLDMREKRIKSVSIVYEVMRKWEKVFNLYEAA